MSETEKLRPGMSGDVLRSWAEDAQKELEELRMKVREAQETELAWLKLMAFVREIFPAMGMDIRHETYSALLERARVEHEAFEAKNKEQVEP